MRALVALTFFMHSLGGAWAAGISLGSGGNPAIVIDAQATSAERFAAEELQHYLEEISGVQLAIQTGASAKPAIRIGHSAAIDAGYLIKTVIDAQGTSLSLSGSDDQNTLFAVYDLLEKLGVRFFGYRWRDGEIIPRISDLQIPALDIRSSPAMKYRFVSDNGFDAKDRNKLLNIADWAAKNRCNAIMLTPSRPGETWDAIAIDEVRKRGLTIAGPGHVLAQFTPDKSLFATHPEYFPLVNGQRQSTYSATWGGATSFCVTNEEATQIVVRNALAYLAKNPCIDIFAVYPPDGSQRGAQCQCENCAALTSSDRYLLCINRIAAAMAVAHPDKKLMWIAYNEFGMPPRKIQPWNRGSNMLLFWCNDMRVHHAPMDAEPNRHAAPYLDWKPRLKTIKTDGTKRPGDLELAPFHRWHAWADYLAKGEYQGDTILLDYYNQHVGNSLSIPALRYCQSGPWDEQVLAQDFRFYLNQNITGWQNCTDYYNDAPNAYWNRLTAQMMWDPSADITAMRRDFYHHAYGPAAKEMESYFTALWREIITPEISANATLRVRALEKTLTAAEAHITTEDIKVRLKAARAFHKKTMLIKQQMESEFTSQGLPKSAKP